MDKHNAYSVPRRRDTAAKPCHSAAYNAQIGFIFNISHTAPPCLCILSAPSQSSAPFRSVPQRPRKAAPHFGQSLTADSVFLLRDSRKPTCEFRLTRCRQEQGGRGGALVSRTLYAFHLKN